jgi:plastocyanin
MPLFGSGDGPLPFLFLSYGKENAASSQRENFLPSAFGGAGGYNFPSSGSSNRKMGTATVKAAVLLAAALVLAAAGCAGPQVRDGEVPEAKPEETTIDLLAGSYFFSPNGIAVPAGEPSTLRVHNNASIVPHSFVLEDPGGKVVVRRELKPGDVTVIRLPALPEGTYTFYCDKSILGMSHRAKGMEGTLTVTAPAGTGR